MIEPVIEVIKAIKVIGVKVREKEGGSSPSEKIEGLTRGNLQARKEQLHKQ